MAPARGLLGRDVELAELTGLLDEAAAGHQRVALVCGDPGIGKTALVETLATAGAERGFTTVWGRCWEGGGGAPYWPWTQVLRACLATRPDLATDTHLARVVPELGDGAAPAQAPVDDSQDARLALFQAVAAFLAGAAQAASGLVVAVDDLHDADEGSLHLLRFLARQASASPLLLVGTYRVLEVARSPAHQRALGAVAGHGPTIRLRGLSPPDVDALLERAGADLAAAHTAGVHRLTDGNPFLVFEASRLLHEARGLAALEDHAGSALVHARLDALPPELRRVLTAAAVLGREFGLDPLGRLCGRGPDDLMDLLEHARDLHVAEESALGRWSFSHALLREALLRQVDAKELIGLHAQAAEALGREGVTAAVAHHLVEAGDPRAVGACQSAAGLARDALAFEDAAGWYERALPLVGDDRIRYDLLLDLGDVLVHAGEIEHAIDTHERAIKAAQALGSLELAAEAAVRIAPFTSTNPAVIGALDDALTDLPDEDSSLRARVLVAFAQSLRSSSIDRTVLARVNRQGLEMARRVGDPETLWGVLTQWHETAKGGIVTHAMRAERGEAAAEMVRLAEESGSPIRILRARLAQAYELSRTGRPALALAEAEDVERMAQASRHPVTERHAREVQFDALLLAGDLSAAERLIATLEDPRGAGGEFASADPAIQLLLVRRAQGRFEELESLARNAVDKWTVTGVDCFRQVPRVIALAELGRRDEARVLLDELVGDRVLEESFGMTVPGQGWVPAPRLCCPCALAEACSLLGDRVRAELLYGSLLPYVEEISFPTGVCARFLGLLAGVLERFEEADAHFRLAHVVGERLGAPVWAAQSRLDHGRMLLARDDPDDHERARELLEAARDAFQAMGVDVYAQRAAALAASLAGGARVVHEGEYWAFHYEGNVARLRDSKGLQYLAQLLRRPGEEWQAVDLAGGGDPERARQSVTRAVKGAIERLGDAHPMLGEHLRSTVRTGVSSTYVPDPRAPLTWRD